MIHADLVSSQVPQIRLWRRPTTMILTLHVLMLNTMASQYNVQRTQRSENW